MQLLRRMQQLLGDKLGTSANSNSFLRELFPQRLPPNAIMVLASADTTMDLNKLVDMADKVIEVSTTRVASIRVPESQQQTSNSEIKQLREDITRLTELVSSLNVHPCQQSRSTSCRTSNHAPQHQQSSTTNSLCWYHIKFGEAAQKCKEPCNWENSRTLAATNAPDQCPSRLFFIKHLHTHTRFLVDTRSEVSVVPPSSTAANIHQIN